MNELQITTIYQNKKTGILSLPGCFTALLLFTGIGGWTRSVILSEYLSAKASVVLWLLGAAVIFAAAFLSYVPIQKRIYLIVFGAAFFICAFLLDLTGGFFSFINAISKVIGSHIGKNLPLFAGNDNALLLTLGWLCVLLALSCCWIVYTKSVLLSWIISGTLLILTIALGLSVSFIWIAVFFAGILFLRFPFSLLSQPSRNGLLTWILFFVICFVSAGAVITLSGENGSSFFHSLHTKAVSAMDTWRYGDAASSALHEGNFKNLGDLNQTEEPQLEVSMDQPESYYLRGFVGSDYSSDGWYEASSTSLWDGSDLFYWLHKSGFYGTTQLSSVASLLDGETSAELPVTLKISTVGASRRYIYAPYELTNDNALLDNRDVGDTRLTYDSFRGLSSYTLTAAHNQVKRYATLSALLKNADANGSSGSLSSYLASESHYNSYVYKHFLDVPEDLLGIFEDAFGKTAHDDGSHTAYAEAKQDILSWLDENIQYSETIPERNGNTDFLTEFLTDTKAGYDVHYATAAVMMMRYMGIPARYVEGYLITPAAAESTEADEILTLTGEDSHAWSEIYQDGIGWIPFEVTPKYLGLMEQEDQISGTGASDNSSSSNSPNQDTPEEDSLDMNEDYHDDPDNEEETEDQKDPSIPMIRLILRAGAVLLMLALLVLLIILLIRFIRKYRSFRAKDRRLACQNIYTELHRIMGNQFHWKDCIMPSYFTDNLRGVLGDQLAEIYKDVLSICQKASFSSHEITEEEYQTVFRFYKDVRKLLRKSRKSALS